MSLVYTTNPSFHQQSALVAPLERAANVLIKSKRLTVRDKAKQALSLADRAKQGSLRKSETDYARTLIRMATTREDERPAIAPGIKTRGPVRVPRLYSLLLARNSLTLNRVRFTRTAGDRTIFAYYDGEYVGRISDKEFTFKLDSTVATNDAYHAGMVDLLQRLNDQPSETIRTYGKASGLCPWCLSPVDDTDSRLRYGAHAACVSVRPQYKPRKRQQ